MPRFERANGTSKQNMNANATAFSAEAEPKAAGEKQGCHVFALKAGKGYTPWYVGKVAKNFKQIVSQTHNLLHLETYPIQSAADKKNESEQHQ